MLFSTCRIIDANLNRSREGLRVIEEWCRFVVENQNLALEIKEIRHEIIQIAEQAKWGRENLLRHRNTEEDVGVKNSTPDEYSKDSEKEIILANFSRVQESLRVLEEYGKTSNVGHRFEHLRYQIYTLEKKVMQTFAGGHLNEPIYILLTKSICRNDYFDTIKNLCDAGARLFQIREKELSDLEFYHLALKAIEIIKSYGGTVIVNDRFDLALAVGADGVHLGTSDLPVLIVRKLANRPFLIGATVHSQIELEMIPFESIDYLGIGPCFPTETKPNLKVGGIPLVQNLYSQSKCLAFVIGGVSLTNISKINEVGIKKVAVCSSILSSEDPGKIFKQMLTSLSAI